MTDSRNPLGGQGKSEKRGHEEIGGGEDKQKEERIRNQGLG